MNYYEINDIGWTAFLRWFYVGWLFGFAVAPPTSIVVGLRIRKLMKDVYE